MKKIVTLVPVLCLIFLIAGCQQNKDVTETDSSSRENYSGIVTDRFSAESGSDKKDQLKVAIGENSTKIFSLVSNSKINGADDVSVGDQVEIECKGDNRSEDRTIMKITVLPAESEFTSMVMVNGALYYDTGNESVRNDRCGTMDGEITSTVDASETPAENDQSNFGSGYGYQYGGNGIIEVFRNDKWIVFEQRWVEYTYEDSAQDVKFSFKYPEGWELTEEHAQDGDQNQDGSKSTGISFQFHNPDSDIDTDQYLIMASLLFPFEVDESLFESEPFETDAGLAATKYTRELDNRVYVYYIFGDGETIPQYTAIATMSVSNYTLLEHDIEAVTKTLKILAD